MPALSGGIILYSSRSAKSVAWSRLNVIGVRAFFFLPVLVAALTRADEFHSVWKTGCPAALSHFASSPSCVVFPEPSIPSTTNSFPGYSCGVVGRFSMPLLLDRGLQRAELESNGLAEHLLQRLRMPVGGPELQFRVASRAHSRHVVIGTRVEV